MGGNQEPAEIEGLQILTGEAQVTASVQGVKTLGL